MSINVLSCFDGISCGQVALNRAGVKYDKYFASEIHAPSITITQNNYPKTIQLGDINEWESWDIDNIDLLIGGSPCQGFSNSGIGLNFEDPRSKLFFTFIKIFNSIKPKYFLFENVKMKKEWCNIISEYLGVKPHLINSSMFVPQNRERYYWTNLDIKPPDHKSTYTIQTILQHENEVSDHYYLTEQQLTKLDLDFKWSENKIIRHKAGPHQQDNIYRYDGIMACLSAATHGAARHLTKTYLPNGRIRRLTENECERLQGLPKDYTKYTSSGNRYEVLGNGWTVPVIAYIFNTMALQQLFILQ